MKILVVDDEWIDRKAQYLELRKVKHADIDLEFAKAPSHIREKLKSEQYDLFLVDVRLDNWGGITLHQVLDNVGDVAPVVLVSSAWDQTNFEELRNVWPRANIRLAVQWREICEERSRPVVALHLQKVLDEWHQQDSLGLNADDSIRILHLSDLQFGGFDEKNFRLECQAMNAKIRQSWGNKSPTFIAITGDIVEEGLPSQYHTAENWLKNFVCNFDDWSLPNARILVVPGNHDVCLPLAAAGRVSLDKTNSELRLMSKEDVRTDFDALSSFAFEPFRKFALRASGASCEDSAEYWLNTRYLFSAGLVFFGINSSCKISPNGFPIASLPEKALENLTNELRSRVDEESLRNAVVIGLLHHSPFTETGNRGINNPDEFELFGRNLGNSMMVLHGHVHSQDSQIRDYDGYQVLRISAPTPTQDGASRPADSLRGFNLLQLNRRNGSITDMEYSSYGWHINRLQLNQSRCFDRQANGKWNSTER